MGVNLKFQEIFCGIFCLAKSEWMSIYNGQCVETLYIFTSILLSQPLHPSAKKIVH